MLCFFVLCLCEQFYIVLLFSMFCWPHYIDYLDFYVLLLVTMLNVLFTILCSQLVRLPEHYACCTGTNSALWVGKLVIGFPDVTFQPSRDNFPPTFLINCAGGKVLGTTTCPKTVVEVKSSGPPHVLRLW